MKRKEFLKKTIAVGSLSILGLTALAKKNNAEANLTRLENKIKRKWYHQNIAL